MPEENQDYQSNQTDSYTKLLFEFEYGAASGVQDKIARSVGSLKTDRAYDQALSSKASSGYKKVAGCDLAAIFMPFRVASLPAFGNDTMPTVWDVSNARVDIAHGNTPFQMDTSQTDTIINRYIGPSGDSMPGVVSSDQYYGDVNQLRDPSEVRSVGFRLPMMGVGWGRGLDGRPWPSGSDTTMWAGEVKQGSMVDPRDYQAAPIDFRYSPVRRTWSCDSSQIIVENNTGSDLLPNQIVGISSIALIDPASSDINLELFKSDVALTAVVPSGARDWGNFAVVTHAIPDTKTGFAKLTGLVQTQVDIKNENHDHADIIMTPDVTKLQSYGGGSARIVWKEAGSGIKWCIVDLKAGDPNMMMAEITGSGIGGSGWYEAREVVKNDAPGNATPWITVDDGAIWDSTTGFGEIYHPNGSNSLIPASGENGSVVTLFRNVRFEDNEHTWTILGSDALPPGSGIYKVLQLDENNEPFWDYLRAVDI